MPALPAPALNSVQNEEAEATSGAALQGHILVAEDNHINQMLVAAYLEQFGLTFDLVGDGRAALEAVQKTSYDAVLMDVMMPVMDGVDATKAIRALGQAYAALPIIALTANARKDQEEHYLNSGMTSYISKPLRADRLFALLAQAVRT